MGSPPSAGHTTPWPRPGRGRVLWPEARSSDSAVPRSRPCRTGTAAPEPKRSGDPPHAPWFVSATHGPSAYPCSRSRRIPCRLHQPESVSDGERAILAQDGPEHEVEPFVTLSDRILTARRAHSCDGGCSGGTIEPGDLYQRLAVIEDGRFSIIRLCRGCNSGKALARRS